VAFHWEPFDPWQVAFLPLYLLMPTIALALLPLGWMANRDLSADPAHTLPSKIFLLMLACGAAAVAVLPAFLIVGVPWRWQMLGYVAIVVFLPCAVALMLPRVRRKIRWIRDAEDVITIQSLQRTRRTAKRLKRLARSTDR